MKKHKFIIPGELHSLNAYIDAERRHWSLASNIKKKDTRIVQTCACAIPVITEGFPLEIHIDWYTKNARLDIDNVSFGKKFIFDGIVSSGRIPDDSRKYIDRIRERFFIDKNDPRIEVTLILNL
jgi:hypothetical protein